MANEKPRSMETYLSRLERRLRRLEMERTGFLFHTDLAKGAKSAVLVLGQVSRYSSEDEVRFTFNLGVRHPTLCRFEAELGLISTSDCTAPPDWTLTTKCCVLARLGEFLDPPRDKWWVLQELTTAEEFALTALLESAIVTHFTPLLNEDALLHYLERSGSDRDEPRFVNGITASLYAALLRRQRHQHDEMEANLQRAVQAASSKKRELVHRHAEAVRRWKIDVP